MARNDFANSQDLVKVKRIEKNTLVLKDGGLRQVLMVSGINFALQSEKDQELTVAAYQNMLNSLDFQIQVLVHSRKININKYLDRLKGRKKKEPSPLLQNQIEEYKNFINEFVAENAIMQKTFFVVVPWFPATATTMASSATKNITGKISDILPFGGKEKEAKEEDEENAEAEKDVQNIARITQEQEALKEALPQLNRRVAQVEEGLRTIGLNVAVLDDEQLIELVYNFYNPETTEKKDITLPEERDVPAQGAKRNAQR